jgi:hypothetical protein
MGVIVGAKYKAIQLSRFFVIVKNNEICKDRDIKMKNSFTWKAEAEQVCDELNKVTQEIKVIICDTDALEIKQ